MASFTFRKTISGFGSPQQEKLVVSANGSTIRSFSVPRGKTGTLTTRTSASAGIITVATGHGITSGKVDFYWIGGVRRNMSVTGNTGTTITLSGGAGDDLPVQDTAIVGSVPVAFTVPIPDTSLMKYVGFQMRYVNSTVAPTINPLLVLNGSGTSAIPIPASTPEISNVDDGDATQLTEDSYDDGTISNPSSIATGTFSMSWLLD